MTINRSHPGHDDKLSEGPEIGVDCSTKPLVGNCKTGVRFTPGPLTLSKRKPILRWIKRAHAELAQW